jgi:XisI protein
MDKLDLYRQSIQSLLCDYASIPVANGEIESQTVFDVLQDHYQVVNIGWNGDRRVYGCVIHIDIRGQKVWIQHNSTELQIAQELAAMGISREDIILGFQAPYVREYTGYGVA